MERIRWGNVARLVFVLAVGGLVVHGLPRFGGEEPSRPALGIPHKVLSPAPVRRVPRRDRVRMPPRRPAQEAAERMLRAAPPRRRRQPERKAARREARHTPSLSPPGPPIANAAPPVPGAPPGLPRVGEFGP
jgi:hypothetical protein